jgi:hypothetical protein
LIPNAGGCITAITGAEDSITAAPENLAITTFQSEGREAVVDTNPVRFDGTRKFDRWRNGTKFHV